MHQYRTTFLGGLAVGFVLGTRAGRERYEQIKKLARTIADNPAVQQAAGALEAQGKGVLMTAWGKVAGGVGQRMPRLAQTARHKAGARIPGLRNRSSAGGNAAANGNPSGRPQPPYVRS